LARKRAVQLDLDMAYMSFIKGDVATISADQRGYVTRVDFVLGLDPTQCALGQYELEFEEAPITISFSALSSSSDDPIVNAGKDWDFGVSGNGVPKIPFIAFTDNRGCYPAVLVKIVFPYRLATWIDPAHVSGLKMDRSFEDLEVLGLPRSDEKIVAIRAINKLLRANPVLGHGKLLRYEDVTTFTEVYYRKDSLRPLVVKLTALASERAYKDAVEDFLLDGFDQQALANTIATLRTATGKIQSENDLVNAVSKVITDILAHHVENRRWVDAFWDGARTITHEGERIDVPRKPKNEARIQPTIHVILDMALRPLGVQVIRESDEGIGSLDFRCMTTTTDGNPISVGIEFKLAHHKEIKHGIRSQLPAYLRAMQSQSGIFCVMWFKDKDCLVFDEPKKYDKEDFVDWLRTEAVDISTKTGFSIIASVIDASIKVSASII
jgi:hypothetical protein